MTENKTEDWAEIATDLRRTYAGNGANFTTITKAADLCERMARGELVERSELVRVAERCRELQYQCSILEAQRDGRQPIHRATGAVPRADEHTDNPYACGGPRKPGGE